MIRQLVLTTLFILSGSGAALAGDFQDLEYPKTIERDEGSLQIHHPVIDAWDDYREVEGWIPVEVTLREWKSDVAMRMRVIYDVIASVYNIDGDTLASNNIKGEEVMGGGFEKGNAENAARTFEAKMTELLRNSDIQDALSGAQ